LDLKGRVLFMDDDQNVFEIAKELLQKAGMEVIHAKDGQEAIDLYSKALNSDEPFNLVILDLTIPGGMGGKETIKRLYEIDPSVVAIVTSGYSEDIVMSQYKDYGFSGVVKKPFDFKQLVNEVKRVLSAS
ncbi:MAG: response regulator, partial [Thermodesulfovibrionales bacterium]|nr:response regulator [Thermodesulfovibrionales bacterium]